VQDVEARDADVRLETRGGRDGADCRELAGHVGADGAAELGAVARAVGAELDVNGGVLRRFEAARKRAARLHRDPTAVFRAWMVTALTPWALADWSR
jgi:hypothetical protein